MFFEETERILNTLFFILFPMSIDKYNLDWTSVERALEEGTFSGYKIAVIETEKIFRQILEDKKIPGTSGEKQIEYAKNLINLPQRLKNARATYQKIIQQPHFEINRDETKDVIAAYYQAITDLAESQRNKLNIADRLNLRAKRIIDKTPKQIKRIAVVLALLSFFTLFLGRTSPGQQTAAVLVGIANFMVFRVFLTLAIISLAVLIIFGVLYFRQRRK